MHYGRQDTTSSDARKSFDHSDKHKENCDGGTYNESCRGEIELKIRGLPHSAVQEHDHIRKKAVQKLIHQFETHPSKEVLQADLKQNRAFNQFSEQWKEMIYFEIREITPKIQCPNSLTYWTKGTVYCTCGNMLTTFKQSSKTEQRPLRCSVDSNYVIKKAHPTVHVLVNTERERIYHAAHLSSEKAKKKGVQIHIG